MPYIFRSILSLFILMGAPVAAFAQPDALTIGKDFWVGFMHNYETDSNESLDLFIVSDQATSGTVTVPGMGWSQNFTVVPNVTTTVTVPNNIAEVYSNQTVQGRGVHIETVDEVAVFAINFNPFTADGTKILPKHSLGTDYIVAAYSGLSPYDSELVIVSSEDGTEVQITPSVATSNGNAAGVPFTVQLDEGETYQVMAAPGQDLTGTKIQGTAASGSCRPFAVFSGAGCTNIPSNCVACDHIYEQNFPIELWGTEYYITPFVFELSPSYPVSAPNYTYRILAAQNGTSVSIDGGAPITLNAGQFQEFNYQTNAHCIISALPISVIQYMEGISCGGNGDPAMLIIDDITKKIDYITFSTVESDIITDHYLNIVIDASDIGLVMFDGALISPNLYQSFGNCGNQVWAGFEITEGSHTLDSQGGGVSGYVYGNGDAESYAYSVGSGSFGPPPPIEIDEAICTNNEVTLEMSQAYLEPVWYNQSAPDDTLAVGYTYTLPQPLVNGIYIGVANEFISGCEEEFYFSVEIPAPPPLTVYPNTAVNICQYESVQLHAEALPSTATYYYNWSPATGLDDPHIANPVATPLSTTTYTVTVSTPTGCGTATGQVTITVNGGEITHFEAIPEDAVACMGEEVGLDVIAEKNVWSDDFDPGISWGLWGGINNGTANATCGSVSGNALYFNGSGDRSATTVPIDCSDGGTIYFSLKIASGVAPCDNAEPGDNVVLEYSLNGVSWINISTYFESAYPNFTGIAVPIPAAAQGPTTRFRWKQVGAFANGQDNWVLDDVFIGAIHTQNYSYTWTPVSGLDDATIPDPQATPNTTTMYHVQMIDSQTGCDYTDSVLVTIGGVFQLTTTPDTILCDVQGIQLHTMPDIGAASDYEYLWTPNTNVTGATTPNPTVSPATTTTYHVVVTSEDGGCVVEDDVVVTVSQLLDLTVAASDQTICAGQTINLTALASGSPQTVVYTWSPAESVADPSAPSTTAIPVTNTTYVMTVVNESTGCQLQEQVSIVVTQAFTIDAQPDAVELCITDGLQMTTTNTSAGPLTWSWSPAVLVSSQNTSYTQMVQNTSAEIVVLGTNSDGCAARDTVFVTLLTETTDLGPDTGFCEDAAVMLDSGWPEDYTIVWNTGDTTSIITVDVSGIYSVEVTSPLGCFSEDEIAVEVFTYPVVDLGADVLLCEGESHTISAGPPGLNYTWSNGSTTPEITVTEGDFYEVTVDNDYCFSSDGVSVYFAPLPEDPFQDEYNYCFGIPPYQLELNAQNPGYMYEWLDGSTSQTLTITEPGFVSVSIHSPLGCERDFGTYIIEYCPGTIWIPNSFSANDDNINDVWLIKGSGVEEYHLEIWNRWGELIFESFNMDNPWMGERRNGLNYVVNDSYLYRVTVRFHEEDGTLSEEQQFEGHVTMVR